MLLLAVLHLGPDVSARTPTAHISAQLTRYWRQALCIVSVSKVLGVLRAEATPGL